MRIKSKFAFSILFFLFVILTSVSFSDNVFSRLEFTAANQFGVPLENVSFLLECNTDKSPMNIFPMEGKTFICKSNKAGMCSPGACFACSVNSTATVYAQYYEQEISQPIFRWQGYRYYTDCYAITAPANTLSRFTLSDYQLVIQVRDQKNDYLKTADVTVSSPNGFYATCKTDEVGECVLYNVPQGTNYNAKAIYNDAQSQDSFELIDNKIVKIIITVKPKIYNLGLRFFDKTGKSLPGFEVSIYSNNKSSYIINTKSARETEIIQINAGDLVSYLAKYQNTVVKNETLNITSDMNISITADCELCNDGVCRLSCTLPPVKSPPKNDSVKPGNNATSTNTTTTNVTKNLSLDDFLYVIEKIDNLIGKEKQKKPRLKLVFVPIGYNETNYNEFKNIAQASVDRFLEVSPLRECKEPKDVVDVTFVNLSSCNIEKCSDICGSGIISWLNKKENCQFVVQDCANKNFGKYDLIVGLCKGVSCGNGVGGCANNIPGVSAIVNTQDSIVIAKKRTTHELGHTLGLYHIKSQNDFNGCTDNEQGACLDPNGADCNLSKEEISKNIMAYCPIRETYGPTGYAYLKNTALYKYTQVCR